jgi:hypothetical protein
MLILHIWRTIISLGYIHTYQRSSVLPMIIFVSVRYSRLLGTVNAYADYDTDRGMTVVQRHIEKERVKVMVLLQYVLHFLKPCGKRYVRGTLTVGSHGAESYTVVPSK